MSTSETNDGNSRSGPATRAEVCAVACAEAWRGEGEILANPIGTIPTIGGRLAKATFEPLLVMTDGEAVLVENIVPLGIEDAPKVVAGWNPYRKMFDVVFNGPRHIMMGATQVDRFGNQNIAFIGPADRPTAQLLGFRGAPGNTINNHTSYWVSNHSPKVFVERVDVVSGIGYDRAAELGDWVKEHHELRRVVTNLAVLDFGGPDHRMRLLSVHPGVTVDDVVTATGFELALADDVDETRPPSPEESEVIARLDPKGMRNQEVSG
jgi:acyl CoA:acetate/3-ketoacid CoA transferase beta subunit